jgi:hypothetical protein
MGNKEAQDGEHIYVAHLFFLIFDHFKPVLLQLTKEINHVFLLLTVITPLDNRT